MYDLIGYEPTLSSSTKLKQFFVEEEIRTKETSGVSIINQQRQSSQRYLKKDSTTIGNLYSKFFVLNHLVKDFLKNLVGPTVLASSPSNEVIINLSSTAISFSASK